MTHKKATRRKTLGFRSQGEEFLPETKRGVGKKLGGTKGRGCHFFSDREITPLKKKGSCLEKKNPCKEKCATKNRKKKDGPQGKGKEGNHNFQ